MAESFVEKRRRELGLTGGQDTGGMSFVERRRAELGLGEWKEGSENAMRAGSAQARIGAEENQRVFKQQESENNRQTFEAAGLGFGGSQFNRHMDKVQKIVKPQSVMRARSNDSYALDDAVAAFGGDKAAGERLKGTAWEKLSTAEQRQLTKDRQTELYRAKVESSGLHNAPFIGEVLKVSDRISDSLKPVSNALHQVYTPGAGLTVMNMATNSAGNLISKLAPGLAGSAGGRLTQNVAKEVLVGAPVAAGNKLARDPNSTVGEVLEEGLYGAGGGALFPVLGAGVRGLRGLAQNGVRDAAENAFRGINAIESNANPSLALPAPRARGNSNAINTPDIINVPETGPRGLPAPDLAPPTTGRIERNPNIYIQKLENLFATARQLDMPPGREREYLEDLWSRMASREDPSLDELIDLAYPSRQQNRVTPDLVQRARTNQQARDVYGVPLPAARLSERYQGGVFGTVEPPVTRVGARRTQVLPANTQPPRPRVDVTPTAVISKAREEVASTVHAAPLTRPMVDDATVVSATSARNLDRLTDETGFTRRMKTENNLPPELAKMLDERMVTAPRTTNERNQNLALQLIKKRGADTLYSDLMRSKKNITNSIDGTAARLLAEHYGAVGDYDKAYDLLSKVGVQGREAGQFLQSLSQWRQFSAEGVLKAADRQLNRRIAAGADALQLSDEQKSTFGQMGNELRVIQELDDEAKEIGMMLAKKGGNLSPEEISKLKAFQAKFNDAKGSIKNLEKRVREADRKTINEVSKVAPKNRTRDQVVNYLDAIAADAKRQLAAKRNIGFASRMSEPDVILYSKIGAAYIARNFVKYSDWAAEMVKLGITEKLPQIFVKSGDRFRKANGMPALSELNDLISKAIRNKALDETGANSLRAAVTEIGFASNDVKVELTRDLQRALRQLGDVTGGEMIKAYLNSAMLLNLGTFGRNLGGLIQQITLDKVVKAFAVPVDWATSGFTKNRTLKFFTQNQAKLWKSLGNGAVEGWTGLSRSGVLDDGSIRTEVFRSKKNPFRYLQKATGASIESLDRAGYDLAHSEVMSTYAHYLGKQTGLSNKQIKEQMPDLIKKLDENIEAIADEAATKATYQDENILSRFAVGLQRTLNSPTNALGKRMREMGLPAWMSPEGFGAGDIVLFFAKTPANLIMRGIEYSPLGLLMSSGHLIRAVGKNGVFNQRAFSLALGKTITGTLGLSMAGWDLYNKGILTGPSSTDADVRSLEEASGRGAYKVNVNGLYRYITSGFDALEAKPRKGDRMMDYAWIQPAAISLGMGVSAAASVDRARDKAERDGLEYNSSFLNIAKSAITGGLQTIFENPMFQGMKEVTDAASSFAKGDGERGLEQTAGIFTGVPAMFVPSAVGQARRTTDNQMRDTTDKGSLLRTAKNQVMNKIPGLSKKLPQSYDVLGKPREYVRGGEANSFNQVFQQLISPIKNSKYSPSADAQLVLDLIEQTGDNKIIPRLQKKTIEVTDPVTNRPRYIDLTPEQFSELQRTVGEETMTELRQLAESSSFSSLAADKKADKIQSLLTKVGTKVRNDLKTSLGYKVKK